MTKSKPLCFHIATRWPHNCARPDTQAHNDHIPSYSNKLQPIETMNTLVSIQSPISTSIALSSFETCISIAMSTSIVIHISSFVSMSISVSIAISPFVSQADQQLCPRRALAPSDNMRCAFSSKIFTTRRHYSHCTASRGTWHGDRWRPESTNKTTKPRRRNHSVSEPHHHETPCVSLTNHQGALHALEFNVFVTPLSPFLLSPDFLFLLLLLPLLFFSVCVFIFTFVSVCWKNELSISFSTIASTSTPIFTSTQMNEINLCFSFNVFHFLCAFPVFSVCRLLVFYFIILFVLSFILNCSCINTHPLLSGSQHTNLTAKRSSWQRSRVFERAAARGQRVALEARWSSAWKLTLESEAF